jgi:hypothetical protein
VDAIAPPLKPFAVRRSPFSVHRSPFAVRRSPFTVHRSPFTVHRSLALALALALALTLPNARSTADTVSSTDTAFIQRKSRGHSRRKQGLHST